MNLYGVNRAPETTHQGSIFGGYQTSLH